MHEGKISSEINYILIVDNRTRYLLPVEDILHVKAVRIYSVFYLRGQQRQYISSRNLGDICRELNPKMFLRVHKSHVINLQEIKSCELARGGKITLSDDTVINVAQRRKAELIWHLKGNKEQGTK